MTEDTKFILDKLSTFAAKATYCELMIVEIATLLVEKKILTKEKLGQIMKNVIEEGLE